MTALAAGGTGLNRTAAAIFIAAANARIAEFRQGEAVENEKKNDFFSLSTRTSFFFFFLRHNRKTTKEAREFRVSFLLFIFFSLFFSFFQSNYNHARKHHFVLFCAGGDLAPRQLVVEARQAGRCFCSVGAAPPFDDDAARRLWRPRGRRRGRFFGRRDQLCCCGPERPGARRGCVCRDGPGEAVSFFLLILIGKTKASTTTTTTKKGGDTTNEKNSVSLVVF